MSVFRLSGKLATIQACGSTISVPVSVPHGRWCPSHYRTRKRSRLKDCARSQHPSTQAYALTYERNENNAKRSETTHAHAHRRGLTRRVRPCLSVDHAREDVRGLTTAASVERSSMISSVWGAAAAAAMVLLLVTAMSVSSDTGKTKSARCYMVRTSGFHPISDCPWYSFLSPGFRFDWGESSLVPVS